MLRRPTLASSTRVPANSRPVHPNASMRQGQNADERANATVRRWNVAYGGPSTTTCPASWHRYRPVGYRCGSAWADLKAPKPAATSAYLTASEIFPLETRALAIACFYALGTLRSAAASGLLIGVSLAGELRIRNCRPC